MAPPYGKRPLAERWRHYRDTSTVERCRPGGSWIELQAATISEFERCALYTPKPPAYADEREPILDRLRDERDSYDDLAGPGRSEDELIADAIQELERLRQYLPENPYPAGASVGLPIRRPDRVPAHAVKKLR